MNLFIQLPPPEIISSSRDAEPLILAVDAIESVRSARVKPTGSSSDVLGSMITMRSGEKHLVAKSPREIADTFEHGIEASAALRPAPSLLPDRSS